MAKDTVNDAVSLFLHQSFSKELSQAQAQVQGTQQQTRQTKILALVELPSSKG